MLRCTCARFRSQRRSVSTSAGVTAKSSPEYVSELVRRLDYVSYLPSFFYPASARRAYLAIRAFNIELASIKDNVSNPMIGKMRLAFWRDALEGIFAGRPAQHPIALELSHAARRHRLTRYHVSKLIDAREADLTTDIYHTLADLAAYARSTQYSLLSLQLQTLDIQQSLTQETYNQVDMNVTHDHKTPDPSRPLPLSTIDHALSHLAVSLTLTTLLRALPHHAAKRSAAPIPSEIASKHSLVTEELFRSGGSAGGLRDAVYDLAGTAFVELEMARKTLGIDQRIKVPVPVMPALLSATSARSYLTLLERARFDAFEPSLQRRYWRYPFQVWHDSRRRIF
ncbi:uncharacterized protein L969DRAFT_92312 [Mixia osmundae IAM 14324]|uniref:NADH dehydrogenase (Ubiquinone) complex I, assembly factor 6 n=1 Tax=Mixia osmundae (strain CBS 9802 / IAM 14324 / JCM 22182 / KY 12970) TaxID=764103 RepID=G7DTC2_MIXOS|nr:uncharacterized protein L969DRAFT_92312 [Mixia osmundae IAM 14324]KEI42894.1 hypothetical protein L969DRAFT_92312 [Mixia osmundae IAM 14324]GAA93769.1 hypothetical protein E5Q_00415 [Mixia osmundae IAM 14324]